MGIAGDISTEDKEEFIDPAVEPPADFLEVEDVAERLAPYGVDEFVPVDKFAPNGVLCPECLGPLEICGPGVELPEPEPEAAESREAKFGVDMDGGKPLVIPLGKAFRAGVGLAAFSIGMCC